ncbi:MAG: twin-arginine translocase subunit TatC, partial [Planctomycetota bacterium]
STKRKFFIVGAFIVGALFTPPDWVTQILLACPLIVLFEIGILLSRGIQKKKDAREKAEEEEYDREMRERPADPPGQDDEDTTYPAG